MNNYVKLAQQYSKAGYSVIPVTAEKQPAIPNWGIFQTRPMKDEECEKHFSNVWGIALLCGGTKMVTGLDFDTKYTLYNDLVEKYKAKIPPKLLKKMYVQTTKSGGFHWLFSCDIVEGNQKLASRYSTAYERDETYREAFSDSKTRDRALKIATNDKVKVLIETRGGQPNVCGGYVVMSPSPGYEFVYGKINHITEEEYHLLMEVARSFNEVIEEKKDVRLEKYKDWKVSPFDDFNTRGDVLGILLDNGWEQVGRGGKSIRLKRAGRTSSQSSALFDPESRVFNCFSTSTVFDTGRGYSPADVFITLEADGDASEAFKKLIQLNYGEQ